MSLLCDVERGLGDFKLSVRFSADAGLTALFGRSGSGKTSVIRTIAGLLKPQRGRIVLGDNVLFDSERRIDVPAHRRAIGYVFQEDRLFPHLSVAGNLAYGERLRGQRAGIARDAVLELLDIGQLLHRNTAHLSGGERQRVSIARALLSNPRLLLMDEPLSSLDENRKLQILPYIERLRDQLRMPIVYVSHSLEEVTRLATQVAVLANGQLVAQGPLADVLSRLDMPEISERSDAGAVLLGRIASVDASWGLASVDFDGGRLVVPATGHAAGSSVRLRILARDVGLALHPHKDSSVINQLPVVVTGLSEEHADRPHVEVQLRCGATWLLARITRRSAHELGLKSGSQAYALIKSVALDRHGDSATG